MRFSRPAVIALVVLTSFSPVTPAAASQRAAAEAPRVQPRDTTGFGGVYQSLAATPLAAVDLTSRWVTLPLTAMLVSVLVATVAAYFIYADE